MRGGWVAGAQLPSLFALTESRECALSAPIRARGWPLSGLDYPLFWQEEAIFMLAV